MEAERLTAEEEAAVKYAIDGSKFPLSPVPSDTAKSTSEFDFNYLYKSGYLTGRKRSTPSSSSDVSVSSCKTFSTITTQESSAASDAFNSTVSDIQSRKSKRDRRKYGIPACESLEKHKPHHNIPAGFKRKRCFIPDQTCSGSRFTEDHPSKSDATNLDNWDNFEPNPFLDVVNPNLFLNAVEPNPFLNAVEPNPFLDIFRPYYFQDNFLQYQSQSMNVEANHTQINDYPRGLTNEEASMWLPSEYPNKPSPHYQVSSTFTDGPSLHGLISPPESQPSSFKTYKRAQSACAPLATNSSFPERNPIGKASPYSTQSHDGESESCLETDVEASDDESEASGSPTQHLSNDPFAQLKRKVFGEILGAFWDIYNKEYASIISHYTLPKETTQAENNRLWDCHKEEIHRLYITENQSLQDTRKIMGSRHGIDASKRTWRQKLREWNYEKWYIEDIAYCGSLFEKWVENCNGQKRVSGERTGENSGNTDNLTSQASVSTSLPLLTPVTSSGKRKLGTEQSQKENDDQGSQDPNGERAHSSIDRLPFRYACPFRKHNPRKYNIHHFQRCALGCFGSMARLKEHIYRRHIAPIQCVRCWLFFKDQDDLNVHMTANNICDRRDGQPAEGITPSIEKKLRKRTRLSEGQKDEDRWRDMYQIIFPGEEIPSPFFEPVQDEVVPTFETSDISFEEFLRQEVPDIFTSRLQTEISNMDLQNTGLLDDPARLTQNFVTRLRTLIAEAQDAAIQSFRQRSSETTSQVNQMLTPAPSSSSGSLTTPMRESQGTSNLAGSDSNMISEDQDVAPPPSLSQVNQELTLLLSSTDIMVDEEYQPKRKRRATDEADHSINYTQSRDNGFISHNFQEDMNFDASYFLQSDLENDMDLNNYDWPIWNSKTTEKQERTKGLG